jgi:hypothetical protein
MSAESFESALGRIADKALARRKLTKDQPPSLSALDRIKALLSDRWMTAQELSEVLGFTDGYVGAILIENRAMFLCKIAADRPGVPGFVPKAWRLKA